MIAGLELLRLRRSHRPRVAVLSIVFFLGLMLLGFYTYAQTETRGNAEFRYTFENSSYFNGLTFALYAFYFGFLLVLPIFAAVEGGSQIAGDASGGALGLLLARPITRTRLFLGKLALAAGLTTLLTALLLGLGLALGLVAVGWGNLDLYPGVLQMTDRRQHLEQGEALLRFLLAWPAASLAMLAPLSLAFLVSAFSRSAVNAVGAAIAIYLVLYVASQIHFFAELRPWLFPSAMPYWRELFREQIDWRTVLEQAARLAGFTLAFLALALGRFRLREER